MYGKSYERPYAMTSISAPAFVAAYGLVGVKSDVCSVFESMRFSPYTLSVDTCRNRRISVVFHLLNAIHEVVDFMEPAFFGGPIVRVLCRLS